MVFRPKDPTRTAVVAVAICAAVCVWIGWKDIAAGDMTIAGVLGGFVLLLAAIVIPLARRASKRTITVTGPELKIAAGETVNLNAVQAIEKRKVRAGKHSYVAYFAVQSGGRETMLFAEGAFPEQTALLELIAARTGLSIQDRT